MVCRCFCAPGSALLMVFWVTRGDMTGQMTGLLSKPPAANVGRFGKDGLKKKTLGKGKMNQRDYKRIVLF